MWITGSAIDLFMIAMGIVAICSAIQFVIDATASRARILPLGPPRCDVAHPPARPELRLIVTEPVVVMIAPAGGHPRSCGPFAYGPDARPARAGFAQPGRAPSTGTYSSVARSQLALIAPAS